MTIDSIQSPFWPFVFIFLAGFLPTEIWRWMGVMAGSALAQDSEILIWVKAVATGLIASVIGTLIVFPTGALAETSLLLRVVATLAGYGAFFLAGKRVLIGILVAEAIVTGAMVLA